MILSGGWRLAARMLIQDFEKLGNTSWCPAWLLDVCAHIWSIQLLTERCTPNPYLPPSLFPDPLSH